jgi:hypothetical protein
MDIRLDDPKVLALDTVQQRAALDPEKVHEYAALYCEDRDLGRLVFFHTPGVALTEGGFVLAEGFHRRLAALDAGLATLPAEVYEGTVRDAILYATSHNLHGKPLTNADKRKRVLTLLQDPEWSQWSDNAIAKHCGVSQPFVGTVRASLITVIRDAGDEVSLETVSRDGADPAPIMRTYTDGHGQVRTMDTSQIGQHAPEKAPVVPAPATINGTVSTESTAPAIFTLEDAEAPEEGASPEAVHRNRWGSITEPLGPTLRPFGTGDFEWYTPPEFIALEREVLGEIDTDPASCEEAQQTVQARIFYTLEDDGLSHPWYGNVHLNPPYQMPAVARFCGKLLEEIDGGHTTAAILLINSVTDTDWFHTIAPRAAAICFTDGRVKFIHAIRDTQRPCQGQAVLYFGPHVERFAEVFAAVGLIMQVYRAKDAGPQLALPAPTPALPETAPTPAPVATGTIAARIVAVLRAAPDGMENYQVAQAIGKDRKRSYQALERLMERGIVRKEGLRYHLVPAKETV